MCRCRGSGFEGVDIGPAYVRRVGSDHRVLLARRLLAELPDQARWRYVLPRLHEVWEINALVRRVLAADVEPASEWNVPPPKATLVGALRIEGRSGRGERRDGARAVRGQLPVGPDQRQVARRPAHHGVDRGPHDTDTEVLQHLVPVHPPARRRRGGVGVGPHVQVRSDRPREVRTTAQRVVDALVPSGNWPLPARHFGELLLDRPPVLGDDQAVIVAHLDDARRR
jgi:hypothetical protein